MFAVAFDLGHVAAHSAPAPDLLPLEPSARIVGMNPTLLAPHCQWSTGIHAKIVEGAVAGVRRQLGPCEPRGGELLPRIRHVFSAKHSKLQHLLGRQLRAKLRMEIAANGDYPFVPIAALHAIVDGYGLPS